MWLTMVVGGSRMMWRRTKWHLWWRQSDLCEYKIHRAGSYMDWSNLSDAMRRSGELFCSFGFRGHHEEQFLGQSTLLVCSLIFFSSLILLSQLIWYPLRGSASLCLDTPNSSGG